MNLPNKLTLLRIIFVLPFIATLSLGIYYQIEGEWEHRKITLLSSGVIFAFAMVTDFIDGYLARKNQQITTFGKLFDPLADKFMTTSALILLSIMGVVPFYISLLFILRDLLVDGSRNIAAKNNVNVAAGFFGKTKTMIMSIGIVLIFFIIPFFNFELSLLIPEWRVWLLILPMLIASIFSTISGIQYFQKITPYINMK